jgi:hypothetical protein
MPNKAWWSRKHSVDVVKVKGVRKEVRKDANSASRKAKDNQSKEQSKLSRCCNVCSKMSDAVYHYYD